MKIKKEGQIDSPFFKKNILMEITNFYLLIF